MSDKWLVFSDEETESGQVGPDQQTIQQNNSGESDQKSAGNNATASSEVKQVGMEMDTISAPQSKSPLKTQSVIQAAETTKSTQQTKDPHIQQYQKQMGRTPPSRAYDFSDRDIRVLHYNDERAPYRRRQNECKTVSHDAFLATVLPIIEFLTEHAITPRENENDAAVHTPGSHEPLTSQNGQFMVSVVFNRPLWCINAHLLLAKLFPQVKFHVFEVFSKIGIDSPGLHVYNFSITDSRFQRIRQDLLKDVLYANICDENQFQMQRAKDPGPAFQHSLETQRLHIHQLRPLAALCRLQLPYDKGETIFFHGTCFLPIFDSATSATVYLLVKPENPQGERTYKMDTYSNQKHEEQMFYFNTTRRVTRYDYKEQFNFECFKRFDHCYDCTCFYNICLRYLQAARGVDGKVKQLHMVWLYNQIDSSRPVCVENRRHHQMDKVKVNKNQQIQHKEKLDENIVQKKV